MLRGLLPAGLLALSLTAPSPSSATLLYVASYGGAITTLNLTLSSENATLTTLSSSDGCARSPAWITLDHASAVLYCTDEGLTTVRGSVTSFRTSADGVLEQIDRINTIQGPVSAVVYGKESKRLAVAHYAGSSLSTLNISNPTDLSVVQTETFTLPQKGPVPSRQDAPHPHQAVVDPTNNFILVPDLGADLIRIFSIDQTSLRFTLLEPFAVAPGSGPRHISFLVAGGKTFMYLISELTNTITGYEVKYTDKAISFTQTFLIPTHGEGKPAPAGASAAEIQVSPDGKFLVISSRMENAFNIPSFDGASAQIPSDVLVTFTIDQASGKLSPLQESPAGGRLPRHFTMNKAGNLVAVGLQQDSRVAIIERDVATGKLGRFLASTSVEGAITTVIFDE